MSCSCPQVASWLHLETLAQSRTVCVEKLSDAHGQQVVRKSYRFPSPSDQVRGMLRGTLFGKAKAEREFAHLQYLHRAKIPAVQALRACVQRNVLGFVVDSHLITIASPGQTLSQCVVREQLPSEEIWAALGASLSRMHQVGFWHRGLAPRNVLILDEAPFHRWLDPAKSKIYSRTIPQAARADDLLRFWGTLHKCIPSSHKQAFEHAYGQDGVCEPANLWRAIPKRKRASIERILHRDETRFEES